MRRIPILLILMLISAMPLVAQNQLYGKYQNYRDVRYVCITQTMLQAMEAEQPDVRIDGRSLSPIRSKIKNILIIRSANKRGREQMEDDLKTLLKDKSYELMMEQNNEGKRLCMLFRKGKTDNEFVLLQSDDKEAIFIVLTGRFTAAEINKIF